jgi:tRNA-Thr(GGU) m(6)t(6)A37 methyltransferase TsaA
MELFTLKSIGIIHTPFKDRKGMPIQPAGGKGVEGHIDLYEEYQEGLKDLDGFSHIILVYLFHQSHEYELHVKPFLDHQLRGVFSTRAPKRPNPIGLSVVRLEKIEQTRLFIKNLDILDGTPLLDIKPYVPEFDAATKVSIGWLSSYIDAASFKRSDHRFE